MGINFKVLYEDMDGNKFSHLCETWEEAENFAEEIQDAGFTYIKTIKIRI